MGRRAVNDFKENERLCLLPCWVFLCPETESLIYQLKVLTHTQ